MVADRQIGGVDEATRTVWDRLRTELNFGQYLDVVGTAKGDVTADMARAIMANKTAGCTIVQPLQLGAAMAGSPELGSALAAHGMPLGIAFQLRDDMLGAFGDSEERGSPSATICARQAHRTRPCARGRRRHRNVRCWIVWVRRPPTPTSMPFSRS